MYVQTLIAIAVVVGMALTIFLLGRKPVQRRPVVHPYEPGTTARPNVTQYRDHVAQSR